MQCFQGKLPLARYFFQDLELALLERLSLWGLLRDATWNGAFRRRGPGCGLIEEVPGCPVLVPEATCGPELTALVQGLEDWSVQEGLTGGPAPRCWKIWPCGSSPLLECTELPESTLAALPYSNKPPQSGPPAQAVFHWVWENHPVALF